MVTNLRVLFSTAFNANKYCVLKLHVHNEHVEIKFTCGTDDLVSFFFNMFPVQGMGTSLLSMEFAFLS